MNYKCLLQKFSSKRNDLRLITIGAIALIEWAVIWPSNDNLTEEQQGGICEDSHFNTMLSEIVWPNINVESEKKLNEFSS